MDESSHLKLVRFEPTRTAWLPPGPPAPAPVLDDRRADDADEARVTTAADRAAAERFVALYRTEFVTLTRSASALVGDWGLAEDIVQTVFAEVFKRWTSIGGIESLGGYLHRAVINRCRSHYRDTARAGARRTVGELRAVADPADNVVAGARSEELRAALLTLSARQRECVVAHFLLEQTETETAAMLGISVGSVRTHTRRGLHALQKAMKR